MIRTLERLPGGPNRKKVVTVPKQGKKRKPRNRKARYRRKATGIAAWVHGEIAKIKQERTKRRPKRGRLDIKNLRACGHMSWWKAQVRKASDGCCARCQRPKKRLDVDHVVPLSELLKAHRVTTMERAFACKELWDPFNGQLLCLRCHRAKSLEDAERYGWSAEWVNDAFDSRGQ